MNAVIKLVAFVLALVGVAALAGGGYAYMTRGPQVGAYIGARSSYSKLEEPAREIAAAQLDGASKFSKLEAEERTRLVDAANKDRRVAKLVIENLDRFVSMPAAARDKAITAAEKAVELEGAARDAALVGFGKAIARPGSNLSLTMGIGK